MTDRIEEITQKIYNEGITKAKDDADQLIAEAQEKADAIIRSAKKKQEEIIHDAQKQAAKKTKNERKPNYNWQRVSLSVI